MSLRNYLSKRMDRFKYAFEGMAEVSREPHMRIHILAACVVVIAGAWFSITPTEWMLVILAIVSVIAGEAFNSALESLANLVSPDYHPLIKRAKDIAAAAVLLLAIGAVIIGVIIFLPRIKMLL